MDESSARLVHGGRDREGVLGAVFIAIGVGALLFGGFQSPRVHCMCGVVRANRERGQQFVKIDGRSSPTETRRRGANGRGAKPRVRPFLLCLRNQRFNFRIHRIATGQTHRFHRRT